ncbi:hypothetical protein DFH06DRAFT_578648 [Mycena polygramma]|nr:hypothetical protein DFH06DRAFT_578648 [Mycena polygramma]
MSLTHLPYDTLLDFAKQLDVRDFLHFLSICRVMRELGCHRTLWLNALLRIKRVEMHPIPFFTQEEIDTMSLPELQNVVRKVDRLMKNFSSHKPRPIRIQTLAIDSGSSVSCVPGTNIVLTITEHGLSCWDVVSSQRVHNSEFPVTFKH